MNDSIPILRVENLEKRVNGFTAEIPHLEFFRGKIYGFTGPNGSGKTTLISMLNLLEKPDRGRIFFDGSEVPPDEARRLPLRRRMAMVLENPYMFNSSVLRNATYGLRVRPGVKTAVENRASDALALVGLSGFEHRKARELSRGETQRVAIARAIVLDPDILFLDEPFTNIDRANVYVLEELIREINRRRNTTIVFTTHDLFQAYRLSDEIVSIVKGRIVRGCIDNLLTGHVVAEKNAEWVRVTPDLRIAVVTEMRGDVHALIPPQDIILSSEPFQSSARNVLQGTIKRMEIEGETVRVCCDAGAEFIALITKKSFDRMELSIGAPLYLTFKTTSVSVF